MAKRSRQGTVLAAVGLFIVTGGLSMVLSYTVPVAAGASSGPTVSAVSPNAGPTSGGTAITITGTGFVSGATVVIGQGSGAGAGAIAATNVTVVTSTEITAITGGGAKAGAWSLYVSTAGGTSAANIGDNFSYEPTPTVSKVSPNAGPVAGGTAITITGRGFVKGTTVVVGQGSGLTGAIMATNVKVVSPTEITAVTGGGAKPGSFGLFVITPGGTSVAKNPLNQDFTYYPLPTISAVSPNSGPTSGGTAITITGTGFISLAVSQQNFTVEIGQGGGAGPTAILATNINVGSSTTITAITGGGAKAGTFGVFVIASSGGTSIPAGTFTYR